MLSDKHFAFEQFPNSRVGSITTSELPSSSKEQLLHLMDYFGKGQGVSVEHLHRVFSNAIGQLAPKIVAGASLVREETTRTVMIDFANLLRSQSTRLSQNVVEPDWPLFIKVATSLEATGDSSAIGTATMIREFANSQRRKRRKSGKQGEETQDIVYIAFAMAFLIFGYLNAQDDEAHWLSWAVGCLATVVTIVWVFFREGP